MIRTAGKIEDSEKIKICSTFFQYRCWKDQSKKRKETIWT